MFGKNQILKPEIHSGDYLDVVEIFPTIQGEGLYSGYQSVFIRLGGCNLACSFCDTEFDSYKKISITKIIQQVLIFAKNKQKKIVKNLVVITGGEPMRQPIAKLCKELIKLNFIVQIETNGTLFQKLPNQVKIICSPKNSNGKYFKIREDLLSKISAIKFLISKNNRNYSSITDVGQSKYKIPVYVQPIDEYDFKKNSANVKYAMKICEDTGSILSLQLHKILKIK